jgi:hypothetical protein
LRRFGEGVVLALFFRILLVRSVVFLGGSCFFSFLFVLRGVERALSLFVGCPTANPSSRRKEKASRTEKFLLACWCCLQPQLPSHHKT